MKNLTKKLLTIFAVFLMMLTNMANVKALSNKETGSLTISGLDTTLAEGETVTFYRIATITYADENTAKLMEQWDYAPGYGYENIKLKGGAVSTDSDATVVSVKDGLAKLDEADYEKIINELALAVPSLITPQETKTIKDEDKDGTVTWVSGTKAAEQADVEAGLATTVGQQISDGTGPKPGIYIAKVTDSTGTKVYNPALLSLVYDGTTLEQVALDLTTNYRNSATLKSSNPGSDKAIKGNEGSTSSEEAQNRVVYDDPTPNVADDKIDTLDEDATWETTNSDSKKGYKTVSVGDKVDYEAEIRIPEYPLNSTDQTIWFKDTMDKGLTFDSKYFTMKLTNGTKEFPVLLEDPSPAEANVKELKAVKPEYYTHDENATTGYYKKTDGTFTTELSEADGSDTFVPEGQTDAIQKIYTKTNAETLTIGKIKFTEGAPNGGFIAYVSNYAALRKLVQPGAEETVSLSTYKFRLDYSAILNENAVTGVVGNKNKLTYVYSNTPLNGTTHKNFDEATGRKRFEDEEIVYTYEIAILKTDVAVENPFKDVYTEVEETEITVGETVVTGYYTRTGEGTDASPYVYALVETANAKAEASTTYYVKSQVVKTEAEARAEYNIPNTTKVFLPGAQFDVYDKQKTDPTAKKIAHVVTNEHGVASVDVVAAGTYYFYETKAPEGYSADPTIGIPVEARWTTCTWSHTQADNEVRYTSDKNAAADGSNAQRVGWIKGGKFYENTAFPGYTLDETDPQNVKVKDGEGIVVSDVFPAYVKSYTSNITTSYGTLTNKLEEGTGMVVYQIKNSKNPKLPSTGGIGTYLFTIAGVAIIATAAFMLIFRKKEGHTH